MKTRRTTITLVILMLVLTTLACSTQSLEQQMKTEAAEAGQTVVAKGESLAQTQAAELFESAKDRVATEAPNLFSTAQAHMLTRAPQLVDTAQAYLETQGPEFRQTAEARIATEGLDALENLAVQAGGQMILIRALDWVEGDIAYDAAGSHLGYRTDSTGYISFAWSLQENGSPVSPDAMALGAYWAVDIAFADLQPGDILNNKRPSDSGYAVLFAGWLDESRTRFKAYELNPTIGQAEETQLTLAPAGDGYNILELESLAPGPYFAQRKQ